MPRRRFNKINDLIYEPNKKGAYELIEGKMIFVGSKLHKELRKDSTITFDAYKRKVWEETGKQDLKSLSNFSQRGFNKYHVDHKISMYYGFINKMDPNDIGHISNLRMIPEKENLLKRCSNHIDSDNEWIMIKYKKN